MRPRVRPQARTRYEGRTARHGEPGHLLVRGTPGLSIFAGYDGEEAATAEAFDEDGFFRTGDRVVMHEDGWIQFGDRTKDIEPWGSCTQNLLYRPAVAAGESCRRPDPGHER